MKQLFILLIATTVLFSCKKSVRDTDTTTNSSEDYALGQSIMYDVFKMVHQASIGSKGITSTATSTSITLFGCDSIIVDTTSTPKTITLKFGSGCSNNGISRSGDIVASFSNNYDTINTLITVNFINYTHNTYTIQDGTFSFYYNGINNSVPTYSFNLSSVKIINANNEKIYWSATQTLKITTGFATPIFSDDTYSINGYSSGLAFKGNHFTDSITTNLTLLGSCNWPSSGIAIVTPDNKEIRTIDFGSACDNNASVTFFGETQQITIP